MTQINARCPGCGDLELRMDDLTLVVDATGGAGTYSFACPHCGDTTTRRVSARAIDMLVGAGANHCVIDPAPLSVDDVEYFLRLLADDNRLAWALDTLTR